MHNLEDLVGTTVKEIYMDSEHLTFVTDKGDFGFEVEGDCCSSSYFYDFHGVKKLLAGNPIVSVQGVSLEVSKDEETEEDYNYDEIQTYGFELVTNDPTFGEVTSVFSFRNASNGYYGGWMLKTTPFYDAPEVTDDVLEA